MSNFHPTRLTPFTRAAVPLLRREGAFVSEKFDGWRLTWHPAPGPGTGSFRTRSGRVLETPKMAAWKREAWAIAPDTILDGELFNHTFRVFDAVLPGGYRSRWRWLQERFARMKSENILLVDQTYFPPGTFTEKALRGAMALIVARGGEGVVVRAAEQVYVEGTSGDAFKLKPVETSEALVVGYHRTSRAEQTQPPDYVSSLLCLTEEEVDFRLAVKREKSLLPAPGSLVLVKHSGEVNGAPKFPSLLGVRSEADLDPEAAETFRRLREKLALDAPLPGRQRIFAAVDLSTKNPTLLGPEKEISLLKKGGAKKAAQSYSLSQAQIALYQNNKNYVGLYKLEGKKAVKIDSRATSQQRKKSNLNTEVDFSRASQQRKKSNLSSKRGSLRVRDSSTPSKARVKGEEKINLKPGQFAVVQSGENFYKVTRPKAPGLAPYCSCPHWLYQHLPANMRRCKHTDLIEKY